MVLCHMTLHNLSLQLLTDLEYAMFSHHVKIQSPLEMSAAGNYIISHALRA